MQRKTYTGAYTSIKDNIIHKNYLQKVKIDLGIISKLVLNFTVKNYEC